LDLRRVTQIGPPASRILLDLLRSLEHVDKQLVLVAGERQSRFLRFLEEENAKAPDPARVLRFTDLDTALEWCEDRVIARRNGSASSGRVSLAEHEFCRGLD